MPYLLLWQSLRVGGGERVAVPRTVVSLRVWEGCYPFFLYLLSITYKDTHTGAQKC